MKVQDDVLRGSELLVSEVGTRRLMTSLIKVRRTDLLLSPGHWPRPFLRLSPRVGIAAESRAAGPKPSVPGRALQWNVPRKAAEGVRSRRLLHAPDSPSPRLSTSPLPP